MLKHASGDSLRAKRDYAMLAMLLGCAERAPDNPNPQAAVGCLAPANATASLLSPLLGTLGKRK